MRPLELEVDEDVFAGSVLCFQVCAVPLSQLFGAVQIHCDDGWIAPLPGNSVFPPEP